MSRILSYLRGRTVLALAAVLFVALAAGSDRAFAQDSVRAAPRANAGARLPFGPGEVLEYRVHVSIAGEVGAGVMSVEGPEREGGTILWILRSEIEAGRGPVRAKDQTRSWFDPARGAITRFEKIERHPLSRSEERVQIDAALGTFTDAGNTPARLGSAEPLDELSFLYFLRTLPLDREGVLVLRRHFDPARNPTIVRILGEETLTLPSGIFRTRVVEMEVRDKKRFRGSGTIRVNIDLGACRVPVQIESRMPLLGTTTLVLSGWMHPPRYPFAFWCDG